MTPQKMNTLRKACATIVVIILILVLVESERPTDKEVKDRLRNVSDHDARLGTQAREVPLEDFMS